MGHNLKGSPNARHVGIAEKRKLVEDAGFALGYGITSIYHLEELYGKILSLSAKVTVLERLRDNLNSIAQDQDSDIRIMRKELEKRKPPHRQALIIASFAALALAMIVLCVTVYPTIASNGYLPNAQALSTPTLEPFYVTVSYRGEGKALNIRTEPNVMSGVAGQFNVSTKIRILEVLHVTEIIYDFDAEEDAIWYNVYGRVGEGLYVPLRYKNTYYTSWRK